MSRSTLVGRVSLRRKATRLGVWKFLNVVVAITTIANLTAVGSLVRPSVAHAAAASVWTTQETCANPADQDANEYANGDHVYVRGKNFNANQDYFGQIHGQPGSASEDPGQLVASFSAHTDGTGYFCADAYTVGTDDGIDDGVYTVDVWDNADHQGGSKNDNYHVTAVVGSLTVNKVVDSGSASADSFAFELSPDPYGVGQFSTTNGSITFSNLPVGNYTVDEVDGPVGYHQVSNDCDVTVTDGGSVSCTVHNARNTQNVKIIKNVVGGSAVPADWTFSLSNTEATYTGIHSGDVVSVMTGVYAISESGPQGYTLTGVSGNCYQDGGFFLYTGSEVTTCTVTNTQDQLTITKTDNHTTALPGETLTYHVTVANHSDATANGVTVTDTLPAHLGTITNISNAGLLGAGMITWSGLSIPGLSSIDLTFDGTVDAVMPNGTTVLHNVADLCWNPQVEIFSLSLDQPLAPTCFFSATATDDTSVTAGPILGLTKTASPTTVNPLSTVTYTVNWSVSGNANATSVVVTDPLPTNINFVSAGNGGVYDSATKTISWNLGTKAPGTSGTVTWVGQVSSSAIAGTIVNTASIDSAETDPAITASATITVVIPKVLGVQSPNLSITKLADVAVLNPGQPVHYTIVVKSTGDGAANNVVVTDTLPAGFTYADGSGSTKTWNLGTMAPGSQQILTYTVTVGTGVTAGNYVNTATVKANDVDPRSASATVEVRVPKILGLATTGVSLRDYMIFAFGLFLLAFGLMLIGGLRRQTAVKKS